MSGLSGRYEMIGSIHAWGALAAIWKLEVGIEGILG